MGLRIKRLRLAGASASAEPYEISFLPSGATEGYRPLSIIAGPSLTGKTTIVDFVAYCLGGSHLPQHDEIQAKVRAAFLEVDLNSTTSAIERAAAGTPSTFATVWQAGLDDIDTVAERRFNIEPTGAEDGLSQYVLASSNLDGIRLSNSVVKEDTGSAMLSVRDLFKVMIVPNDRLDSTSLVYERDSFMVAQKYRQTIEVIFGVYDNDEAVLADRQKRATQQRNSEQARLEALMITAERDYSDGHGALQEIVDRQIVVIAALNAQLRSLDNERRSTESASVEIRKALTAAQREASDARIRVRDRESLLDRLDALLNQYVDDRRKLGFLLDADALFDPLRVTTCPVCFNALETAPSIENENCSLCDHHALGTPDEGVDASTEEDEFDSYRDSATLVGAELRAVKARISSLTDYMARLKADHELLIRRAEDAARQAMDAAAAVDAIVSSPAPWLALRDRITNDLSEAKLARQAAESGVRAWEWVEKSKALVATLQADVDALSRERRKERPDRDQIVRLLSERFASILADIGYPKLRDAYVSSNFVPYVKGLEYTNASSGGRVIIALAWNLALWEIAYEQDADAPGLLILDSPQKNLGHNADPNDEFADATLVERFYAHAKRWLDADGQGAQLIIVDNSPPKSVAEDVIIRFTRRADEYPYGLISDAVI